jgi:hypothetical protein
VRNASNVPWNLGTTYRRQALFMCEGSPDSPRSPTGHPRNKQNGSEECPRSSYHAGRGHQVQGGRRPIMKIPFGEQSSAQSLSAPSRHLWRQFVHQLRPFLLDQLSHVVGDF